MNHSLFVDIPYGDKSIAFCSYAMPKKLVVFVHGFNGSASGTWGDFSEVIGSHASFEFADVLFYGYDSLRTQANNMKVSLFDMLDSAVQVNTMPYPDRQLPPDFQYESIYLVAHSLGAVICRLALLHAHAAGRSWVKGCRLALFAPAHFGSAIPENFSECFDGPWKFLRGFAYTRYPILLNLKEGSDLLKELLDTSSKIIAAGDGDFCKAALVVWAEKENVVISKHFLQDELEVQIPKTSHVTVCKFSYDRVGPLEKLVNIF